MRMEDADRVLQDELKDLEQYPVPITAKWASEMVDPGVWEIVLTIECEGVQYTHRFSLTDLVVPSEIRQNMRWAVIGFARAMTGDIRKQLRRSMEELKQFAAEGKE